MCLNKTESQSQDLADEKGQTRSIEKYGIDVAVEKNHEISFTGLPTTFTSNYQINIKLFNYLVIKLPRY